MHTRTCSKCSGSGTGSGHPDHGRPCLHCVEGITAGPGYKLVWFIYKDYGYPISNHEFHDVACGDLEAMGFEDHTWNEWGEAHVAPAIIDEKTNKIVDEGVEEGDGWYKWNEQGPVDRNGWIDYLIAEVESFRSKGAGMNIKIMEAGLLAMAKKYIELMIEESEDDGQRLQREMGLTYRWEYEDMYLKEYLVGISVGVWYGVPGDQTWGEWEHFSVNCSTDFERSERYTK